MPSETQPPADWTEADLALIKQGVGDKSTRPAQSAAEAGDADGEVATGEQSGAVVTYFHRLGASTRCQTLSWREREVMLHALNGTPNKDLATALGITEGTLHSHWDNIFKKLGVHSKDEARRKFTAG